MAAGRAGSRQLETSDATESEGAAEVTDGRFRRSVQSRARIVEALLELIGEGELLPTGELVAARAGVGLRTVFRHFEDMESLHAEVSARVERLVQPLLENPLTQGSLQERVDALVQQRANAFERATPFKRSGDLQRWRSPFLQEKHATMVRELRRHLRAAIPESEAVPPARRHALELVTSFEAWHRLRSEQALGRERAQEVVRDSVLALLGD